MKKLDLRKELKTLYGQTGGDIAQVSVPAAWFLQIDGEGDPNASPDYAAAVETLFTVSYMLKFAVKRGPLALDYAVMPLEGLWWSDDMRTFSADRKADWKWTMMIRQPECVTPDLVAQAREASAKKIEPAKLERLRLVRWEEGECLQVLHIGPFSEEGPAIERLHASVIARGGALTGKHHEIYLSDIRRAAPEKWRTILRQPFVPAS